MEEVKPWSAYSVLARWTLTLTLNPNPNQVEEVRAVLAGLSARIASELGISTDQMQGLLADP